MVDTATFESKNSTVGCADISGKEWIDMHDDDGNLIYSINPNGNVMNSVCWGMHVEDNNGDSLRSTLINGTSSYFLDRNFYIEPPANIVLTDSVSMRLYLSNIEVYNMIYYLSTLGSNYTLNDLKILKKKGSTNSPVDLFVSNDSIANMSQFTIITPVIMPYGPGAYYMEFKVKDFSEFNPYMGDLIVLPLNLISFSATKDRNNVQLSWGTSSEINTSKFEIQWSADDSIFKKLGDVTAKNTITVNNYSFTHITPANGMNYYRLKQIDKDGKYTFSKTININMLTGSSNITIVPNPAYYKITVTLPTNNDIRVVRIFDAAGRLVLQKSIQASSTQVEINIQELKSGLYILQTDGSAKTHIKFIKYQANL